jgi:hypothetical protein
MGQYRDFITADCGDMFYQSTRNNPVLHSKTEGRNVGVTYGFEEVDAVLEVPGYLKISTPGFAWTQQYLDTSGNDLWLPLHNARARAYESMQPRIRTAVQSLNFIFEVADFMEIIRLTSSLSKGIARLKQIRGADPSKSMAELNLTYQFAVAPVISDLQELHEMFKFLQSEYKEFVANSLGDHTHHYQENIFDIDETQSLYPYGYLRAINTGVRYRYDLHAEMNFRVSNFNISQLDYLTKHFGFAFNASVIWEAIPFSWLCDYIFPIGKMLEVIDAGNRIDCLITDYLETTTEYWTSGHHLDMKNLYQEYAIFEGSSSGLGPGDLLSGFSRKTYHRVPKWPYKGLVLPKTKVPGLKQLLIAASLLRASF